MKKISIAVLSLLVVGLGQSAAASKIQLDSETKRRCVKVLTEGLNSDEFWPAMHAAEGLTLAGKGAQVRIALAKKLPSEKDDQKRCGLARELSRAGDAGKSLVMMEILEKEDDHGHVHAAESLYKVGWKGSDAPLRKSFKQKKNIRLRLMAAAALGKNGHAGALKFLRSHVAKEKDPKLFFLSAWVLGRIGEESDSELIRRRLPDAPDAWTQAFLEHALASLGDEAGKKALMRNLKSDDGRIRTYAAVFAGEIGLLESKALLVKQLDDENLDARIRAAQSLLVLSR